MPLDGAGIQRRRIVRLPSRPLILLCYYFFVKPLFPVVGSRSREEAVDRVTCDPYVEAIRLASRDRE